MKDHAVRPDAESPAASAATARWFFKREDAKSGPVDLERLRGLLADGSLPAETPVWRDGFTAWTVAAEAEELAGAVAAGRGAKALATTARQPRWPAVVFAIVAGMLPVVYGLAWLLGGFQEATVTGVVTAASQPVSGGSVVLAPVAESKSITPGRPAVASVAEDGRYSLRLVPGQTGLAQRFWVRFSPPVLPVMPQEEAMKTLPPYSGLVPKDSQIGVKPGTNRIDIELVPAGGK